MAGNQRSGEFLIGAGVETASRGEEELIGYPQDASDGDLIGGDALSERIAASERDARQAVHDKQKQKRKEGGMRYRALVGMRSAHVDGPKAVRDDYHVRLMKDLLKHWDSTVPVRPYYDRSVDPDAKYTKIIRHTDALTSLKLKHDIDSPIDVLNFYGNPIGQIFYSSIPDEDRKNRRAMRSEYAKKKAEYEKRGKEMPADLVEHYEYAIAEPVPGKATGLYAYSCVNPNGMFSAYDYPIEHAYNGIDVKTSRLVNRNYGTYHDIILLGDLDFEATMLPEVVFRADGRMLESDDPDEIREFLYEELRSDDYVALIECYM